MAKDLNKVQLTGHLGADPEMRYTPQGSAVTNFRVASNRVWKDRDGNQHEDTEWFRIVAWDRLGEICNQYLTKGSRVYVEGRLQTRKWTDRDGNDRYTSEVIAQDMIMLSTRGESRGNGGGEPLPAYDDVGYEDQEAQEAPAPPRPAAREVAGPTRSSGSSSRAPRRNQPQPIEDDDIPF